MSLEQQSNDIIKKQLNYLKSTFIPFKNTNQQRNNKKQIVIPQGAKQIGNYILGKTIGSGTFGKVYLGMHLLTGQKVAVKIIQKQKIQAKDIQRVKNQIQILSTTRHQNLIHLYEIIQTQKSLLLITEYLPNGQLLNHIIKQKKLQEKQACHIFHQIIDGLQYLHKMGITHRDLKPQNIMIDYDNQIKIIDFGLSRLFNKNQKLSSPCGTPSYAAPQVIQCKVPYDPQLTDIWSCGIILYTMVGGLLPFSDTDKIKLYKKIISGVFKPLKSVSHQLRNLLENIIVVNPKDRFQISDIKKHQWWNLVPYQQSYCLYKDQKVSYDEQILNKILSFGYDRNKVIQSLQNDLKNKQAGAYYIYMKKLIKSGIKVPKYIGNSNFDPTYLVDSFPLFQQQVTDTTSNMFQFSNYENETKPSEEPPSCTCTQNTEPHEEWVLIGTKQHQNNDFTNSNQNPIFLKQLAKSSNKIILPSLNLSLNLSLNYQQNSQKKIQQKIAKSQFYSNNHQFKKATTNLTVKKPLNKSISQQYKQFDKNKLIMWLQSIKKKSNLKLKSTLVSKIDQRLPSLPSIYKGQIRTKNNYSKNRIKIS